MGIEITINAAKESRSNVTWMYAFHIQTCHRVIMSVLDSLYKTIDAQKNATIHTLQDYTIVC